MVESTPSIDALLSRLRAGDAAAADELLSRTHGELHRIARLIMRDQRPNHTLQASALVNEAFMRLAEAGPSEVDDLGHFVRRATRTMRTALIDYERARRTTKRGGEQLQLSLRDGALAGPHEKSSRNVVDVDQALKKLEALDPDLGRLVELRFFGGLDVEEAAALMDLPKRTAERRWQTARMWLLKELNAS